MKNVDNNSTVDFQYPMICPHCNERIERQPPLKIVGPKLLIVEGADEQGFFIGLLDNLKLNDVQIAPVGGKTKIREALKAISKDSDFSKITAIGIIRDADSNPDDAFKSIRDALNAAGLKSPQRSQKFAKGPPRAGIMILPSLKQQGALEDLCLQAIVDDPAGVCIERFFACLKQQQGLPAIRKLSKAKVRVFLSSRKDPTLPLGIAAQKGYWPLDHKAFDDVRTFLCSL